MISFVLNLPWTFAAFLAGLISCPTKIKINNVPKAIVLNVKSFWWYSWLPRMKGVRAMALGNVVLLGPNILSNDLEHELIHIEQAIKEPLIHPILYSLETFRKGYRNNKYEVEAYDKSSSVYIEKQ